ncbi:MAG: MBL fold metallo-hydrolase [Anaerolineae bacterium]|jgi:glyoxylase-like metal-dependent hydrolase (beta-lactamase superfamily II)
MLRERVTEDVYVFISSLYAEVSAVVITTPDGAVVVDTLPFPQETRQVRAFALDRCPKGVRYVVNSHHHADHIYGSYLFPEAELVAHRLCRQILLKVGQESLAQAKVQTPALEEVTLRVPQLVFETELLIRLGEKTLHLMYAPGHTSDGIMLHVREDKVLITSDLVTPVPFLVRGDPEAMIRSLKKIKPLNLENVIQGHGGVLLRGEIDETVDSNIFYIKTAMKKVQELLAADRPASDLAKIDIESCGKSRIPLGGLVQRMHKANLEYLYAEMSAGRLSL